MQLSNQKFFLLLVLGTLSFSLMFASTEVFAQESQFLFKWGSFGSSASQFISPIGIVVDSSRNVYITDSGNNRVQKFTDTGEFIEQWGSTCRLSDGFGCIDPDGSGPLVAGDGQFYGPHSIAVDSLGNIYITELFNRRIQKFSQDGVFITKWGMQGVGDGQFNSPRGITVDSSENIYVVDGGNHRIQKFDSNGNFITKWGTLGSSDGQFSFPLDVAADSLNFIYVADANNNRIQKFSSDGIFIAKWGTLGSGDGQLNFPKGVATDSSGSVYVTDYGNYRIQKFTSDGSFVTKWGSVCQISTGFGCIDPDGDGPLELGDGQFVFPIGIVARPSGNVYVIDFGNNRIQVFKIQQFPTISNLFQTKSDGTIPISESSTTTESAVVFKATVSSSNDGQAKLQVEPKLYSQPFDGTNLIESPFVSSGNEATTTKDGFVDGQYHWRARAVDIGGNVSSWQEFGVAGNIDFEIKTVPPYTQRISPYPSETETTDWASKDYAEGVAGNYECGSTIANCGCAITSAVMLLRYYGITKGVDGQDITPGNINAWLNAHQGYIEGSIKWPKVWEYSTHPQNAVRLQFDGAVNFKDTATLDQYVQALKPTILYNRSFGHFLVADGKLSTTHTIKDPAFYSTKYLVATGTSSFIRNYDNHFDGLRLFSTSTAEVAGIYLSLGSPAELLVTDPNGFRLGMDPVIGIVYDEIPGGSYFQEGLSTDALETPPPPKEVKQLWIPHPVSGQYSIKVIGTGSGSYVFDSLAYDTQEQSHTQTFNGNTRSGLVSEYSLNFTPQQPENINAQLVSERVDECPMRDGDAGNSGCPAKIELLSLEKISNSAGVPELVGPEDAVRYTAPVVEGQRGTTEVRAKLYNEGALLGLLGSPRRVPLDQLCAIFDNPAKDTALVNRLIKTTNAEGGYFFGVPSATTTYTLIESVKEIIAGQAKRVCVLETILPRHFDRTTNIALREVNKITVTTRKTHAGEILVEKRAGHTSHILLAGESLWTLAENILSDDSPIKIYRAVRRIAELNNIAVPEWGLHGGQIDVKKLRAGLIIDASLFEE
ncbi:MAG: 6-bladed beta-propeller [Candidatus Azambacteria bacterium]|nr:6-bladed beta-propeller [Candidatus Azambacteria bacterium]